MFQTIAISTNTHPTKANSGIPPLAHEEQTNKHNPIQYGVTPEKHPDVGEKIPWGHTQPRGPKFDNPDRSKKPVQDTQTKITKNQLEQLDTKDVEQVWSPTYQQTITDQPIYMRKPKAQVLEIQPMNEIDTSPTFSHNQIEQLSTYSTPIFMVAIRKGPNVGQKRFIRDFRDQNIPGNKLTTRNDEEAPRTSAESKNERPLSGDRWNGLRGPPVETSTRIPTSLTIPIRDDQRIWPQLPETRGVIIGSPEEQHLPDSQNAQIIRRNYITTDILLPKEGVCPSGSRKPLVGPGRGTLARPQPTRWGRVSLPSTHGGRLGLYQPVVTEKHFMGGLEASYTQPFVERSQETSLQKTRQCPRAPAVSKMEDPNIIYHHTPSTIFWKASMHGIMENPITPNRGNIPVKMNTFTRYPRAIESSGKETVTLAKALLDQWMVRHGSYEQSNDPPCNQDGSVDIPCPRIHTTSCGTIRILFRTAERSPLTRTIGCYKYGTPATEKETEH